MLSRSGSFLHTFLRDPRATGAIAPATCALADSIADAVRSLARQHRDPHSGEPLDIVELGGGTGALTQALRPLRPTVIEHNAPWAAALQRRFPELHVRHECATQTLAQLDRPVGLVTSIPLLNNPGAEALVQHIGEQHARGRIRYCVLYTYGLRDPLPPIFARAQRWSVVLRSLPPAAVWAYE